MELLSPVMWWELFVNIIPNLSGAQCTYKEDPTQRSIFLWCIWAAQFPLRKVEAFIYYRACFSVTYRQSQILAGTYSDRYFYSILVLIQRLMFRKPGLFLKMSFQAMNRGSSALLSASWCLGEVCCRDMGELAMLHCHPGYCWQTRFILWSLLDGKDMSEHPEQWPVVQCWTAQGQTQACPVKVNNVWNCTRVVGLDQLPDLPPALDF